MIEDQARWAIASGLVDRKAVPNLLDVVDARSLDAVSPQAVSIVR